MCPTLKPLVVCAQSTRNLEDTWTCCLFNLNRSATLDSNLFSNYFGACPVISAKGRTFPVTTFFVEDVYEQIPNYRLATDSPAAVGNNYRVNEKKVLHSDSLGSGLTGCMEI